MVKYRVCKLTKDSIAIPTICPWKFQNLYNEFLDYGVTIERIYYRVYTKYGIDPDTKKLYIIYEEVCDYFAMVVEYKGSKRVWVHNDTELQYYTEEEFPYYVVSRHIEPDTIYCVDENDFNIYESMILNTPENNIIDPKSSAYNGMETIEKYQIFNDEGYSEDTIMHTTECLGCVNTRVYDLHRFDSEKFDELTSDNDELYWDYIDDLWYSFILNLKMYFAENNLLNKIALFQYKRKRIEITTRFQNICNDKFFVRQKVSQEEIDKLQDYINKTAIEQYNLMCIEFIDNIIDNSSNKK